MSNPTFQVWVRQFYMSNEVRQLNFKIAREMFIISHWTCYAVQSNKPLAIMIYLKNIDKCNGKTVSQAIQKILENAYIDTKICSVWLIDNTAYMS
ncbi:17792_t:CDS:2, partial [Funneliformis caledonium]